MTRSKTEHPVVATWRTSCQVTAFLVESLPDPLWSEVIPGAPRRTVRMILGHIHNSRCMWLKALGPRFEVAVPASVDRHKVTRRQLLPALKKSADAVLIDTTGISAAVAVAQVLALYKQASRAL